MTSIEEFLRLRTLFWCTSTLQDLYVCRLTHNLTSWGL